MEFVTIGHLPASGGRWHVRRGGGYLWFVNEDRAVEPYCIIDSEVRPIVDVADADDDVPLVQPKANI